MVKYLITDGINYSADSSSTTFTERKECAYQWKTETAANNILNAFKSRKKNPGTAFYIEKMEISTIAKHKENVEGFIENHFMSMLSDVLGNSTYLNELVKLNRYHTDSKSVTAPTTCDIFSVLSSIGTILSPDYIKTLSDECSRIDCEIMDVEHEIELTNFNASNGYRLAKKLQELRRKRREVKDSMDAYDLLIHLFAYNSSVSDEIEAFLSKLNNRTYQCKISA